MRKCLNISIPTATMVRKMGATAAIRNCDDATTKLISRQMSHHPTVGANYYEGIKGPTHAVEAFKKMEELRCSGGNYKVIIIALKTFTTPPSGVRRLYWACPVQVY